MSTLTNDQKAAILDHAAEIQQNVNWITGTWVQTATFNERGDISEGEFFDLSLPYNDYAQNDLDCVRHYVDFGASSILTGRVGKIDEAGEFKACTPATMLEAAKSTCLEGAIALAVFSAAQGEDEYYGILHELRDAAAASDCELNQWNDSFAGSKENVVSFLRYGAEYYRSGNAYPLENLVCGTVSDEE